MSSGASWTPGACSALGVRGDVAEEQIDFALHDLREDALSFFVVGRDPENVTGKRLRESDNTLSATAMSASASEVGRTFKLT